jgi:hypothetical protein
LRNLPARSSWRRFVEALHNSVATGLELVSQAGLDFSWKATTSAIAGSGSKGGDAPLTRVERVKMWEEEEQFLFYLFGGLAVDSLGEQC